MKQTCKQCGKEFILTQSEIEFYKSRGLTLPKRCKECRELNKRKEGKGKKSEERQQDYSSSTYRPAGRSGGKVKKTVAAGAAVIVLGLGGLFAKEQFTTPADSPAIENQIETVTEEAAPIAEEAVQPAVEESAPIAEEAVQPAVEESAPIAEEAVQPAVEEETQAVEEVVAEPEEEPESPVVETQKAYRFRNRKLLSDHYAKHGKDMGFDSAEAYENAASAVVNNPNALHKTEKEDGDDVYYVEATNEFVVVSTDGYIRTYFYPDSGKKYYDKQ